MLRFFRRPINSYFKQYKSIVCPDKNPYRINITFDEYIEDIDIEKICLRALIINIYPHIEKQYFDNKIIKFDRKNEKLIIDDMNKHKNNHNIVFTDIAIYPEPNGMLTYSHYNNLLKRDYIDEKIEL